MHETVESTAVIDGGPNASTSSSRKTSRCRKAGNIRLRDTVLGQEARLRLQARCHARFRAREQAQQVHHPGGRDPKIGVITVGKSYLDVRQALDELGSTSQVQRSHPALQIGCPGRSAVTTQAIADGLSSSSW
jgi:indolepyruvate ferredoxin oxidoreductase